MSVCQVNHDDSIEYAEPEEIVIRCVEGPSSGMLSVAEYIRGHLFSKDAEFVMIVRPISPDLDKADGTR